MLSVIFALLPVYGRWGELPVCPDETTVLASKHSTATNQVSLEVINDAGIDLVMVWVNFDGNEIEYQRVPVGYTATAKSYPFLSWSIRAALDGLLLSTIVTPEEDSKLRVSPCLDEPLLAQPLTDSGMQMRQVLGTAIPTLSQATSNLLWGPPSTGHDMQYLRHEFPDCELDDGLGEVAVQGFYVLCVKVVDESGILVAVATSLVGPVTTFIINEEVAFDERLLRASIRLGVGLPKPKAFGNRFRLPPFALYTADGRYRITNVIDLLPGAPYNKHGTAYLFEAGVFIWPGIKAGHIRKISDVLGHEGGVSMKTISLKPLVYEVRGILSEDDCTNLIQMAEPFMKPSPVSLPDDDRLKNTTNWRTSSSEFFRRGITPTVKDVERRVRDFTRIPLVNGEAVQVLRYFEGQHYYTHHDFFDPGRYMTDGAVRRTVEYGAKNRLATVFWYLNDVPEGGETNFPMSDGNFKVICNKSLEQGRPVLGLSVKPERGKMILFYNMLPDGAFDPFSVHAGCDVGKGHVKWAANKWLWNKPFFELAKDLAGHESWIGDSKDQERDSASVPDW